MKNLLWSKVIGVAMIAGLILPVAVSANGIGGRPANPDPNNPRTSSIFIYNLSGGASKSDQLYVQNGSDKEETIEVLFGRWYGYDDWRYDLQGEVRGQSWCGQMGFCL